MKRRIVIADSDKQTERLITNILTSAGYDVSVAESLRDGYSMITVNCPDIIIIDPLYPQKEGINLIKSLREWTQIPIIAVSANNNERAVIEILDAGADDYIIKPFFTGEFLARIRTSVRHIEQLDMHKGINDRQNYIYNGLKVEFDRHRVSIDGNPVHLTKNEFRILMLLCRYSGKVLTYDFIMKSIWGPQASGSNGILRVNVTNLRRKLEKDSINPKYLFTENGVGYWISENQNK